MICVLWIATRADRLQQAHIYAHIMKNNERIIYGYRNQRSSWWGPFWFFSSRKHIAFDLVEHIHRSVGSCFFNEIFGYNYEFYSVAKTTKISTKFVYCFSWARKAHTFIVLDAWRTLHNTSIHKITTINNNFCAFLFERR